MFKITHRYGIDEGYICNDLYIVRYDDETRVSRKGEKPIGIIHDDSRYIFLMMYNYEVCKFILQSEIRGISGLCRKAISLIEFNGMSSSFLSELLYFIESAFMTKHEDTHYRRLKVLVDLLDEEVRNDSLGRVFTTVFIKKLNEYREEKNKPNVW